ncbi:glycosyltransferase family 2 protein [Geobacter sp.]|uniref:glycosyltransferase family 2 protein n=1 Tax=Geobacter sp. TaxID=46610 RepID=UPI002616ED83|nr:glycosyltransferase family 2 protein [Geobacter sp.]
MSNNYGYMKKVTAVIVTWNKRSDVLNLLDALTTLEYPKLDVIVVDNASTDGTADAVRAHPSKVYLIENRENIGGTGGFNTGIRYALDNCCPHYVWLLDNDARISPTTLRNMVSAMESDRSIGVAGSCILSPEDSSLIVEAGGFVDFRTATWKPHLRYKRYDPVAANGKQEEVHYVPACSALVRTELFHRVGLLDERYFLHWDDVDFCFRVRESGYRVVSVMDAPAYHGVEKGHNPITLYYDFRNALQFFAKHADGLSRLRCFSRILGSYLTSYCYLRLLGRLAPARYLLSGLIDFLARRGGRAGMEPSAILEEEGESCGVETDLPPGMKKIIVFAVGGYDEVVAAVGYLKRCSPACSLTIAAAAERAEAYRLPFVEEVVSFDLLRDGFAAKFSTALNILARGYDCGVSVGNRFTIPYSFLVRKNFIYRPAVDRLQQSSSSLSAIWKIPVSMAGGWLLMLRYLLPVMGVGRSVVDSASNGLRTIPRR